jgi:sortase (surface protein transpeptidase)
VFSADQHLPAQFEVEKTISGTSKFTSITKLFTRVFLSLVLIGSILAVGSLVVPEAYVKLFPERTGEVTHSFQSTTPSATPIPVIKKYEPPFDPSLPLGTWISIPKIGVETEAQATVDPNEALDTGVWLVPDFGRPGETEYPIIMAAHRFGWQWWWKSDYWKKHSFYLLTDTQVGDRIEIVYEQRKWVYEVYAVEEGTEITDYDADLILYTCKFLNSPERYFRYAKLVEAV